ncbi:hypothetical protein [Pseudomonas sp. TAF7]|uniref:hypothetical protein n=1 Tax=Pseudomonas sp. TAF7 TaxID=3233073 RepID=UPI003F98E345
MTTQNLSGKVIQINNKFNLLTPQVENIANTIVSTLSCKIETGSLHIILGNVGSGCSSAIEICRKRLRHKFKNILTLQPPILSDGFNPWSLILEYYGFHYSTLALKVKMGSIPRPVMTLIEHAEIDCIIVEDFLDGLDRPKEKQQAVDAWLSLARHPTRLTVILTTNNHTYCKNLEDNNLVTIHRLQEWDDDEKFSLFIDKLQELLRRDFSIRLNLEQKKLIYKLCNGNTGNLIRLIREYAVAMLLDAKYQNCHTTEYLPLVSAIKKNAILFVAQSSQ